MSPTTEVAVPIARPVVSRNKEIATLATGASVALVGKMAGRGLHLLSQIVLARLLGPAPFGLFAIGWTMLRMAGLIAPLGLDQGVIRYGPLYRHTDLARFKGVLFQALGAAVLSGSLIGGSLYLAAPWLAQQVFHEPGLASVIRWFSPAFAVYSGLIVAAAATRISQRMKYEVYTLDLIQPAAGLVLLVLFYLMGLGLFGAVVASVASFAIAFIVALFYVKHLFPEVFSRQLRSTPVAKQLITFSLPTLLAGIFVNYMLWGDRLLVGFFLSAAEVGIYQAAAQSSIVFAVIIGAFNVIFSPMIPGLHHTREKKRLEELFRVSTKWALYLSLPLYLTICFAPREIMIVVFGPEYVSGFSTLIILSTGQLINAGTGTVGQLLVMTGFQNRWFSLSAVMSFASIALSLLLIPRLGLVGAALGTAGSVSGLFILGLLQVRHCLGLWPYDRRYLKGLLATALSLAALFVLSLIDITSPMFSLMLTLFVSAGVFGSTLLFLGLDSEDWEFIRMIRARLM